MFSVLYLDEKKRKLSQNSGNNAVTKNKVSKKVIVKNN